MPFVHLKIGKKVGENKARKKHSGFMVNKYYERIKNERIRR